MKKRYLFLDMLRAVAVTEMIHGHSLDGLLDIALRKTPFFINWIKVRGYTAPVFLFASGFAVAVATLPRLESYSRFSKHFLKRVQKLLFVILLGYLMYLPYFSLRMTILSIGSPAWENLLKVDILRCIGVSALFLQFWFLLKSKQSLTLIFISMITIALPLLTPLVRNSEVVLGLPGVVRYYFVDSRFPLFYYSSYLFLGFVLGYVFTVRKDFWLKSSLSIAALLIVLALLLNRTGLLPAVRDFMMKGGVIVLLTFLIERCEGLWQRLPSPILCFGQESLVVYVVHLMVVYGSVLNRGLVYYWGPTLAYSEIYPFIIWLMAAMVVLAYVWHKLKQEHPAAAKWVKYAIYVSFAVLFLVKPY
jgi:hypothetical protein